MIILPAVNNVFVDVLKSRTFFQLDYTGLLGLITVHQTRLAKTVNKIEYRITLMIVHDIVIQL